MDQSPDTRDAAQLVAPGHAAGDVLGAPDWRLIRREPGILEVEADLPDRLKNPQGQLFGGFTPTYVDFICLFTVHTLIDDPDGDQPRSWLTTINMRCDYFEPIMGPTFRILGESINQRGRNHLVSAKFFQDDVLAAHAITTLRELPLAAPDMSEPPAAS